MMTVKLFELLKMRTDVAKELETAFDEANELMSGMEKREDATLTDLEDFVKGMQRVTSKMQSWVRKIKDQGNE